MKTYNRICIEDVIHPTEGKLLERGKEYITSEEKEGSVCVYTRFWFWISKDVFAGEKVFTKS